MVCGQAGFFSAPPHTTRARLAFASVRQKYAKNYVCSAGKVDRDNKPLVYSVLLRYWTSMLWSFDTCQNKVPASFDHCLGLKFRAHQDHMFFEVDC